MAKQIGDIGGGNTPNTKKYQPTKAEIEAGELELPEGYELKKMQTRAERIAELEAEIAEIEKLKEPKWGELVEFGQSVHPYYDEQRRKSVLQSTIEGLR